MKIACICAFPRKMNYGMLSVDLAFEDFCSSALDSSFQVTHFNIEEAMEIDCGRSQTLNYELLHSPEEQLFDFDVIVIWGDFTTADIYLKEVLQILISKFKIDERTATDLYFKRALLEDCPDCILDKVMVISSNILPNSEKDMSTRYKDALKRLYSRAAAVIPRDPMSASLAQIFRGSPHHVSCGLDAAFFLKPQTASVDTTDRIGFSFGRTVGTNARLFRKLPVSRFIKALARETSLPLHNIQWNLSGDVSHLFYQKLQELRQCRFIVTDTYHCAINAMREGVPVICIGEGAKHQVTALGDKKKEFLFHSFMAQGLYVFIDHPKFILGSPRIAIDHLNVVLDPTYFDQIRENIETAKRNQIAAFRGALTCLKS